MSKHQFFRPSNPDPHLPNRSTSVCRRKFVRYRDLESAQLAAREADERYDVVEGTMSAYECGVCGQFHIGRNPAVLWQYRFRRTSQFDPFFIDLLGDRVMAYAARENSGSEADRLAHFARLGRIVERLQLRAKGSS